MVEPFCVKTLVSHYFETGDRVSECCSDAAPIRIVLLQLRPGPRCAREDLQVVRVQVIDESTLAKAVGALE